MRFININSNIGDWRVNKLNHIYPWLNFLNYVGDYIFVAIKDFPLDLYKALCEIHKYRETPNMSLANEYIIHVPILQVEKSPY